MKASRTLIVSAFLVFALCSKATGQGRDAVALVERLSGAVVLQQKGNAKSLRLNAKSDLARPLYAGDRVHCEPGGELTLRIGNRVTELDEKSGWFTISRPADAKSDRIQKALAEYGRTGGRKKGGGPQPLVYSPTDESVVMPEMFVLRWIPLMRKCGASLVIQEPKGDKLWRQDNVDGTVGSLDSALARQALNTYRAKVGEGTLFLKFTDSCGHTDQARFDVLSLEDEQALKTELGLWNDETDKLIAHLGRASVFVSYRMFPQVAEEYEAALALAPQSHDLLKRTIDAHLKSGNRVRVTQLEKRLLPGPDRTKSKPGKHL
jgi:hypothetical protein